MNSPTCDRRPLAATAAAVLACAATGLLALYYGTAGFRAVSTEAARRLAVAADPVPLPALRMRRALDGATVPLAAELAADGRIAIVTFVYTRCQSICLAAGTELQRMQREIAARGLEARVRLVTVSFDPLDDDAALAAYARRMGADPRLWRFYSVPDAAGLRALLATFGVVAVPAPMGEFVHNAAFHVVAHGRLRRILDLGDPALALDAAVGDGA